MHTAPGSNTRPKKSQTNWTTNGSSPVCPDSTVALAVACSLCVRSAICRRSYRVPTAACRQQQQQRGRGRGRGRGQSGASSDDVSGVGISNGGSCINLWRLLPSVPRGAACWLRTGAVRTRRLRFCEACAVRVSDMAAGCPVCRADITMVMRIFS